MQSHDDAALEFLESLIIFDRICPFAIENLPPAMSRRVFDVGLDMGRIRNGLKPNREGRRSKSIHDSPGQDVRDGFMSRQSGEDHRAVVPRMKHRKSSPTPHLQRDGPLTTNEMTTNEKAGFQSSNPAADSNNENSHRYTLEENRNEDTPDSPAVNIQSENPDPEQQHGLERRQSDNALNFDLKPPPPNTKVKHIDTLCERLFSGEHLRVILKDPTFFLRFTAFLNRYKPKAAPVLVSYLEAQKALKAIEYANALAESLRLQHGGHKQSSPIVAASIDPEFEAGINQYFDSLVNETLPAYVTHILTKVVTETMVREITGQGMPLMRDMVGGLAEVFCLADPSLKDCPIVYASEEFYHTTRYARDDVLGRNCRFLQGTRTSRRSIARLSQATKAGQESCETVLNYRRDGSAFVNLLLIAPLYDNRGNVRYFLGAQIDVSGLVEDGRGMDSFERLLSESKTKKDYENKDSDQLDRHQPKHLKALGEFGQMLSVDESNLVQNTSRPGSMVDGISGNLNSRPNTSGGRDGPRRPRRVLGEDEDDAPDFDISKSTPGQLTTTSLSSGGRLPGVYQNYFLVRPHPNLRVIFVSPALRIPGLLQSHFLSHIGGPSRVRDGISEAFEQGAAVTAKITWLPRGSDDRDSTGANGETNSSRPSTRDGPVPRSSTTGSASTSGQMEPKIRYIACTPLLGSDDQVGVWIVIMIENELVTGGLASRERALARYHTQFSGRGGMADDDEVMTLPTDTPPASEGPDASMDGASAGNSPAANKGRTTNSFNRKNGGTPKKSGGQFEKEALYADYIRKAAANGGGAQQQQQQNNAGKNGTGEVPSEQEERINGENRIEEIVSPSEEKGPIL